MNKTFIVRVKTIYPNGNVTVWDEIEYGPNANSILQLPHDLDFMITHPEDLAGPIIEIEVK